jgi:hypothetical protein
MEGQNQCADFLTPGLSDHHGRPLTEIMNFERNPQCFIDFPVNFLNNLKIVACKNSISFHLKYSLCCQLCCHLCCAAEGGRTTPAQLHPSRELFCHICHGLDPSLLCSYLNHMQQVSVFRSPVTSFSKSSPVTGLEWPRGFQEVKVKQYCYRPGVAQRVPGS